MKKKILYFADDGIIFTDEQLCLEYEEEKAKYPDDPGVRFYDIMGNELDIKDINRSVYYEVTNSIIANAMYRSVRLLRINQNSPLPINIGCYVFKGNDVFKIEQDLFHEIMTKLKK